MTLIHKVANRLTRQMVADGQADQPVLSNLGPLLLAVVAFRESLCHVEKLAPAAQFQAVVAEGLRLPAEILELHIRPLSRTESDWPRHVPKPFRFQIVFGPAPTTALFAGPSGFHQRPYSTRNPGSPT